MSIDAKFSRLPKWVLSVTKKHFKCHPYDYFSNDVYYEDTLDHTFDPNFHNTSNSSLIVGFFQSSQYFPKLRKQLQRELNFRGLPMDSDSDKVAQSISCQNTVSIHVRRGDYRALKEFDICGPLYYQRAILKARDLLGQPTFWVFSDDISWCRDHFQGDEFNFVNLKYSQSNVLNDMRLMSLAGNHIIANSSYSWWAAWLHWEPSKIVIMPDCWSLGSPKIPIQDKKRKEWIAISPF